MVSTFDVNPEGVLAVSAKTGLGLQELLPAVVDLRTGNKLAAASTGQEYEALEVGYVIPGIKNVKAARVGDTWHIAKTLVEPLPGFKPVKPMVYAGLYPASADEYEGLAAAIERLNLNDASVKVKKETMELQGTEGRLVLESIADYPRNQKVSTVYEPTVTATIIVPHQ
eukprot:gene1863-2200_t